MWDKESIHALLNQNDRAVERAIVAIYRLQTPDEKSAETTVYKNDVGFSAFDAKFMTSLAQQILQGRDLSPRQMFHGRKTIKRYHRQLAELANAREAARGMVSAPVVEATIDEATPQAATGGCTCEEYDGEELCPKCSQSPTRVAAFYLAKIEAMRKSW
jgi:hypothetical protein